MLCEKEESWVRHVLSGKRERERGGGAARVDLNWELEEHRGHAREKAHNWAKKHQQASRSFACSFYSYSARSLALLGGERWR